MEAGYDYLLLRKPPRRPLLKFSGLFLSILGAMLLATSGAYYGYAAKASADLDNLNVTLPGAISHTPAAAGLSSSGLSDGILNSISGGAPLSTSPGSSNLAGTTSALQWAPESELGLDLAAALPKVTGQAGLATGLDLVDGWNPFAAAPAKVSPGAPAAAFAIASQRLYPGESLLAGSWSNPLSFEPAYYRKHTLLRGFTPIDIAQVPVVHSVTPATRIIIPSVNVDSAIRELAILDLGGSRAYETPANTVGHIPATANAGEANSSWFFGHTESLTMGEGSVFFNLRDIPDKLRRGEDVYIIADNEQRQYLYRVTSSQVVHQSELRLYETGLATIHLVSCVPRLVYDHRLIISGELIAIK